MQLQKVVELCHLQPVYMPETPVEVKTGYASDMLSDVVANCPAGALLITIQNHKNTIAVCTLTNAAGVVIAHNRVIPPDMLTAAQSEGVPLLLAADSQFECSLKLGRALNVNA